MRHPRMVRGLLTALACGALAVAPATAGADSTGPLKQTVRARGWSFSLHGPRTLAQHDAGQRTEIVVRHRELGVVARLDPFAAANCTTSAIARCIPIDVIPRTAPGVKRTRLVVSDFDRFVPPEVTTTLYSGGGTGCCFVAVGFWQPQDGPWRASRLDSGMTEPISDRTGRIRIGDPRWDTLDWPRAASRPFYTWHKLINGAGWRHASTRADVRRELRRTTRDLRRLMRHRTAAGVADTIRATRAVQIGYQKALGQRKQVAQGRRAYQRAYGRAALRRVDAALKRVKRARG